MQYLKLFLSIIISFFATFILLPILSVIARHLGVLDVPDGRLKTHAFAIPFFGGMGIFLGMLPSLFCFYQFEYQLLPFYVGLCMLLIVGAVDDLWSLHPYQKFLGQIGATILIMSSGLYLKEPDIIPYPLRLLISFFWYLSVINAVNLVDVMDGLATIVSLVAAFSFFVLAFLVGQPEVMFLIGPLIGALLAFFWYNKPPANMYLGDAGALFIGGCCAAFPFLINWATTSNIYGYLSTLGIMGVILVEGLFLIGIRVYKGIPFYLGSPDHFSIYLQKRGWQKSKILWYTLVMASSAAFIGSMFALNQISLGSSIVCALVFLLVWFLVLFPSQY